MKKLSLILLLCLLLCACRAETVPDQGDDLIQSNDSTQIGATGDDLLVTQDTEGGQITTAPTEDLPGRETPPALYAQPEESSAWANYASYGDKLGIVLNEPVENPPRYTTLWMEGEYECAYIIPRYAGSYVNLYALEWSEDFSTYTIADVPEYSTEVGDGCVIYSALPRPEGIPAYYIEIVLPDGRGDGWVLQYDGLNGTAEVEFFEP